MVEDIYTMKNEILKQAKKELEERGPERMDVDRLGEMIDMIKDLAEAEESCWEAQYYRHVVTDAMENKYGYTQMGGSQGVNTRMGYNMQSERPGYGSMPDDLVEKIGAKYRSLSPDEKMMMKSKIIEKLM